MIKKQALIWTTLSAAAIISPVAIINSCATQIETQIDLNQIVNQATFDVTNKDQFANQVQLSDIKWNQASENPTIDVKFDRLEPNEKLGIITFDAIFTDQNGLKKSKVANQISGFKIADNQIEGQALIDWEVARLQTLNQNNQLVKNDPVSQNDLIKWSQSPEQFIKFLRFDPILQLQYRTNAFSFNKKQIEFTIVVSYQNLSTSITLNSTVNLDESIGVKPPAVENLSIIEAREQARLDYQWQLLTNRVSIQMLDKWEQQPNLLLKALKNFVYQQYFQYHVSELKINRDQPNQQATISFKLNARFWRQSQPKVLTSKQALTFNVKTFDEKSAPEVAAPTNPTNVSWKISPLSDVVTIDFKQNPQYNANKLYINKGGKIDINPITLQAFILQLIKDNKLISVDGTLPTDWDWNKYLDFIPGAEIKVKTLPNEESVVILINYFDHNNLDDVLQFNLKFKNMQLDEKQIPVYDATQGFDQFKQYFIDHVKDKVEFNLDAIVNNQGDHVNQFAMLDEKTFLNYTNQDWEQISGITNNAIRIQTENVQINYLTNEIKFKWVLDGAGEFSGQRWVDDQITTLKLNSQQQFDQSGFNFPKGAYQVELNNFHQFNLNNQMLDRDQVNEKLAKFSQNWTWMARELVTFSWFTLAQAFGNQFDKIAIAIVDHQNQALPFNNLKQKYDDYKIIAKARLKFTNGNSQTFLPFVQVFGSALNLQAATYQSDDEVAIEIDLKNLLDRPDAVQDANEILPGMGQGITLGIQGLGYQNVIQEWPPRFDIWQAQIGSYDFKFYHNQNQIVSSANNHRFISFNLMALYDFQDQFWPKPDSENGKWVSSEFWLN